MSSRQTTQWFQYLYRKGRVVKTQSFRICWEISRTHKAKFGVVIPNLITPRATKRNLVKRRILAVLRDLFPKDSQIQCVICVGINIERRSMKSLRYEIVRACDGVL